MARRPKPPVVIRPAARWLAGAPAAASRVASPWAALLMVLGVLLLGGATLYFGPVPGLVGLVLGAIALAFAPLSARNRDV